MSLSNELNQAILAMDAYNRGYDQAIILSGNSIGSTQIMTTVNDLGQTVNYDSSVLSNSDQAIGFYALVYDMNSDGVADVIAYRGTDYPQIDTTPPKDVYHGWTLGAGELSSEQARMAVEFYQEVAGAGNWLTSDLTLIGHSLGGGLAGYVGAIYDKDTYVYDTMTFELAAARSTNYVVDYLDENGDPDTMVISPNAFNAFNTFYPNYTLVSWEYQNPDAVNLIYGGNTPIQPDYTGMNGYYIEGEALEGLLGRGNEMPYQVISDLNGIDLIPGFNPIAEAIARHSQSAMVIALFKEEVPDLTEWQNATQYFWPILYDSDYALSLGMDSDILDGELQAQQQYADILRMIIAYSAIDTGTDDTNARPFGDTAIRALYDDANDLGHALNLAGTGSTVDMLATDISKVFVHMAGQLALNKVLQSNTPDALDGVLAYSQTDATLSINLSDTDWQDLTGVSSHLANVARENIVLGTLNQYGNEQGLTYLDQIINTQNLLSSFGDGSEDSIDSIVFALGNGGTINVDSALSAGDGATILYGSNGADYFQIDGASNDQYLFLGGDGIDTVSLFDPSTISGLSTLSYPKSLYNSVNLTKGSYAIGEGLIVDQNGATNTVDGSHFINVENFENVTYALITQLGHHYAPAPDISSSWIGDDMVMDYHMHTSSITVDYVAGTVTDGLGTDTFENDPTSYEFDNIIIGTDFGDTYDFTTYQDTFGANAIIYSGSGDDLITHDTGNSAFDSMPLTTYYYAGGDDSFVNVLPRDVHLPNDVAFEDLTFSYINPKYLDPADIPQSSSSGDGYYTLDLMVAIEGYGSITIQDALWYQEQYHGNPVLFETDFSFGFLTDTPQIARVTKSFTDPSGFYVFNYSGSNPLPVISSMEDDVIDLALSPLNQNLLDDDWPVTGLHGNDSIYGTSENNFLYGGFGDDSLDGREGNDSLFGGNGDDTITGGLGVDFLYGGSGFDTAIFSDFFSSSTITHYDTYTYVSLGDGSNRDYAYDIERFQFLDGTYDLNTGTFTPFSLTITGTSAGETLEGTIESEQIFGLAGNDILIGGEGNDDIFGGDDTDKAVFSGNFSDYTITEYTNDITVTDNVGSDGTDTVHNDVETLEFADGTYDYQTQIFTPFISPPAEPLVPIHIEAEAMTLIGDYTVANNGAASGGQNVEIAVANGTGTIQTTFDGGSGTYNLTIGYFDEMDAAPTYDLYVNGNLIESWVADGTFGSFYANAQTLTSHTVNDLVLNTGDVVALTSTRLAGEQNEVDDFYFDPVDQPVPLPDPVFIEAEDMTLIGDYTVANNSAASGGQNVEIAVANGTGTIQTNFSGDTGTYDLTIAYFDEMDAAPTYELYVNGNLIESWVADGTFGSFYANAQTLTSHTINGLTLNPGDVVALTSTRLAGEQNEVDSFHFIPQGAPPAQADPAPLYYEAEDLTLSTYQKGSNSASSNGYSAWLFGSSGTSGTISTEFEGTDGLYDLSVSYFDEDGSNASLELRVNGNVMESWLANEATGSTVADIQSLTQYTIEDLNLEEGDVVELWAQKTAQGDLVYVDTFTFMPGDVDNIAGTQNGQTLNGTTNNEALYGLGGNDTLHGNDGDDLLYGGHGTDILWGEAGADAFVFEEASAFANVDTIADFDVSEGDAIDISGLLQGYDEMQSAIDDFVFLTEANGDTTIAIDRDGTGTAYTVQDIAIIDNVIGLDADTMLTNGNLIVA